MRIWGHAPREAGERRTDSSPLGVSRGMVKVIGPVLTGRMGKRTDEAPRPVLTRLCCAHDSVLLLTRNRNHDMGGQREL
jgi:hypothetical protein